MALPAKAGPLAASAASAASVPQQLQAQVLTWTADDDFMAYASAPRTAFAGPTTIVFENSAATGNTSGMPHTLTFSRTEPGYNNDVTLNILANPYDANGGRYQVDVVLSPGKYWYYCAIPGHGGMSGELIVSDGGEQDTTPPTVTASVSGERDDDGAYVGSATVTLSASDTESGVALVEFSLDGAPYAAYSASVTVNQPGQHTVSYRATDKAGNTSAPQSVSFTVVEPPAEDTVPLAVTATSRCVGTSAYVAVTAVNDGNVPAAVTLTTPYGSTTMADVAPGKQAYQSFNARAGQIGAGKVTVTGTATIDGKKVTTSYEADYTAISCG